MKTFSLLLQSQKLHFFKIIKGDAKNLRANEFSPLTLTENSFYYDLKITIFEKFQNLFWNISINISRARALTDKTRTNLNTSKFQLINVILENKIGGECTEILKVTNYSRKLCITL